jgi:hypothetical protein
MKTIFEKLYALALLVSLALTASIAAHAQTLLVPTTLSAAVTSTKASQIVVASATGITAPTLGSGNPTTSLYIDKELMSVEAVNGTTITVARGQGGSISTLHASGAYVFFGPPNAFYVGLADVAQVGNGIPPIGGGACTRSKFAYLPAIDVATGNVADCLGGVWVIGVGTQSTQFRLNYPTIGAVAYTGLNTNGTAVGATTLYCTEIDLPYNKLITGLGFLEGTTVTGNARYSILYDSAGNPLANGALTGTASATASIFENYAFTAKYFAVGPARYFGCLQDNAVGSTTVRMMVTGIDDNILTVGQTGATFGTVPTLTPPTVFHTAVGPYLYVY